MKLRINSCGMSDCPPSWHWTTAEKGFSDYDLWIVFRGRGSITPQKDNYREIRVHEGAALLLEPNIQYQAKHEPNHPLLIINVHFDFLDDMGNIIHPRTLTAKSLSELDFMKSILLHTISFFNSNQKKESCHFLETALMIFDMADLLTDSESNHIWAHIIYEICAQIDSSKNTPSLSEFAKRYSYSERYIGKMFIKIRGVSFSDYTQNSRISKAKTLLRHTDAPIRVIAEETGFYDACHFSKAFRDTVGISPIAYRKNS